MSKIDWNLVSAFAVEHIKEAARPLFGSGLMAKKKQLLSKLKGKTSTGRSTPVDPSGPIPMGAVGISNTTRKGGGVVAQLKKMKSARKLRRKG